jgi:hypothetical protein
VNRLQGGAFPKIHRRFIAMCLPSGRELYTTRQRKPPSNVPQRAASEYRREVVGSRFGRGASHGIRVVGDDDPWERLPTSNDIPPIRGRVPAGRYHREALGGRGLFKGGRISPDHLTPAGR